MDSDLESAFDLPRPLARGASRCHVLAVQDSLGTMIAACGIACGGFCGDASYHADMEICPSHAEPVCPDCAAIVAHHENFGEWRGAEGNPETFGVRHTVCIHTACPEVIPVGSCWCWEHIDVCDKPDCGHPAHGCEEPVHFCEAHRNG